MVVFRNVIRERLSEINIDGQIVIPSLWMFNHFVMSNLVRDERICPSLSVDICEELVDRDFARCRAYNLGMGVKIFPYLMACDISNSGQWTGYFDEEFAPGHPRFIPLLLKGQLACYLPTGGSYTFDRGRIEYWSNENQEWDENAMIGDFFYRSMGYKVREMTPYWSLMNGNG